MNDIEKIFSHAPKDAVKLGVLRGDRKPRWFDKDGKYFNGTEGWSPTEYECVTLATRPQKTKTVADAYDFFEQKWPKYLEEVALVHSIYYRKSIEAFLVLPDSAHLSADTYKICTREQFEAYAKEQEAKQDGEKWTHRTNTGELCNIHVKEPDVNGIIIVINKRGEYLRHSADSLKPIKPTLTKEQAWDYAVDSGLTAEEIEKIHTVI